MESTAVSSSGSLSVFAWAADVGVRLSAEIHRRAWPADGDGLRQVGVDKASRHELAGHFGQLERRVVIVLLFDHRECRAATGSSCTRRQVRHLSQGRSSPTPPCRADSIGSGLGRTSSRPEDIGPGGHDSTINTCKNEKKKERRRYFLKKDLEKHRGVRSPSCS